MKRKSSFKVLYRFTMPWDTCYSIFPRIKDLLFLCIPAHIKSKKKSVLSSKFMKIAHFYEWMQRFTLRTNKWEKVSLFISVSLFPTRCTLPSHGPYIRMNFSYALATIHKKWKKYTQKFTQLWKQKLCKTVRDLKRCFNFGNIQFLSFAHLTVTWFMAAHSSKFIN